jgi:tetratricopeptide (TPR) repeat protein
MDVRGFIKLYGITDNLIDTYDTTTIDGLNQIVGGVVAEHYDDQILANYCGLLYHYKEKKYDLAERYYRHAVEKNDSNAMNNLGLVYHDQKKYDQAERYYLQAIDLGNISAMNNLGHVYNQIGKYDLAERYYLQAIDLGNVTAMHNLGVMYYNHLEKYDLAERHLLMALEHGKDDLEPTIRCLERLIGNPLKLFVVLDELKSSNDVVVQKLKELMNTQTVRYFANKRSRLSKDGECPVCYDERRLIPRECAHYYCEDCYVRIDRCCFGCDNE